MRVFIILILCIGNLSCSKKQANQCVHENYLYYSDYFVFVADDSGPPLIIPVDVNWTPNDSGYTTELKGWYGTENEWPIGYFLKDSIANLCHIPQEAWEHSNNEYFQFNAATREIISTIWNAPKLRLTIPDSTQWVKTPAEEHKLIYGCKTTAKVDGTGRSGWLIYERIRREANGSQNFGDFEAFFWLPLVIDGDFYHFAQHRGTQTATKWSDDNGVVTVTTIPEFTLNILGTSVDSVSGRTNIPDTLLVLVPEWNINLTAISTGSQVGHGPMFPNGLAYYRQSLLQPALNSPTQGYGMLELILEDD